MRQRTKHQILDDVVKHMKKQGGQAKTPYGKCVYIAPNNRTCGHSMALKVKYRKLVQKEEINTAHKVIDTFGDECHLKKYQGHSIYFWRKVQDFHDTSENWNSDGTIRVIGTLHLERLKREFTD